MWGDGGHVIATSIERGAALSTAIIPQRLFAPPAAVSVPKGTQVFTFDAATLNLHTPGAATSGPITTTTDGVFGDRAGAGASAVGSVRPPRRRALRARGRGDHHARPAAGARLHGRGRRGHGAAQGHDREGRRGGRGVRVVSDPLDTLLARDSDVPPEVDEPEVDDPGDEPADDVETDQEEAS